MHGGHVVETGPTRRIFKNPQHPYTQALLGSIPRADRAAVLDSPLRGQAPDVFLLPDVGCRFVSRCPAAMEICRTERPPLVAVEDGHTVLCQLHRVQPAAERGSLLASYVASRHDASLTWRDVHWLASLTRLPILLKGIVRPDDAVRALDAGAAGVIVSNHGARQLDGAPATIEALPAIADAIAGRCPVLMDGGIRWGTDVLKAIDDAVGDVVERDPAKTRSPRRPGLE